MADFKEEPEYPEVSGWLFKWTNYLRGYQKRWFVLSNGLLSYYRDEEEMYHTCRGTLSLQGATITTIDGCNIIVTNGETYHIKARSEPDMQRWLIALELSNNVAETQTPSSSTSGSIVETTSIDGMKTKLRSIQTTNDLMMRQCRLLNQTLIEFQNSYPSVVSGQIQEISETANNFRATTTKMIRACSEYLNLAESHRIQFGEKTVDKDIIVGLQRGEMLQEMVDSSSEEEWSEFYDCEDLKPCLPTIAYPVNVSNGRHRRSRIPCRPRVTANLWSAIKNCIGKDLAKIPVPASWCEPLSMLQRLTEDFEYAHMLDKASSSLDPGEQLAHVAGFAVSSYSTTEARAGKPFNPLLGETYECDRTEDLGWKSIAEQVSHHPPVSAIHCQGNNWECWQEQSVAAKFRGTYMQIAPQGELHLKFKTGNYYTWNKVLTNVHNIIIGKLWIDQEGEMTIKCHTNGFVCKLTFVPQSVFGREARKVKGTIVDNNGITKLHVVGSWDDKMSAERVNSVNSVNSSRIILWERVRPPQGYDKYYNFTVFACQLNEMESDVAPTDSRYRPDQRLLEEGDWEKADKVKLFLEEKQRETKKVKSEKAGTVTAEAKSSESYSLPHEPVWFKKSLDPVTKKELFLFQGEYWECKKKKDWSRCPELF